jgi:hypothetical protein
MRIKWTQRKCVGWEESNELADPPTPLLVTDVKKTETELHSCNSTPAADSASSYLAAVADSSKVPEIIVSCDELYNTQQDGL